MDDQFYIDAITTNFKNVTDITEPVHSAVTGRVLIAHTPKGSVVCKFGHPNICRHDVYVSQLLLQNGINVPKVRMRKYGNTVFTSYDFIPNHSLEDFLIAGAPPAFANTVYKSAFNAVHRISKISVRPDNMPPYMFSTQSEYMCSRLFGSRVAFYHNDLHAGNILVGNDGRFGGLLDITAITLGGQDVFLARTWSRYAGTNFKELLNHWAKISGEQMTAERIERIRAMSAPARTI